MTFEVGERVRVLPGARSNTEPGGFDCFEDVAGDKTGLIDRTLDAGGDYGVQDGYGNYWAFAPEFLESLEETPDPTPEVKVGDKVRVTVEGTVTYTYHNGNFEIEGSTGIPVDKAKVEILETPPKVGDFVDPQGDYVTGTVAVLDNNAQSIIVRHAGIWTGNVIGDNSSDYLSPDRWKIIYIPEEGK